MVDGHFDVLLFLKGCPTLRRFGKTLDYLKRARGHSDYTFKHLSGSVTLDG